jgi:hypothetical protein
MGQRTSIIIFNLIHLWYGLLLYLKLVDFGFINLLATPSDTPYFALFLKYWYYMRWACLAMNMLGIWIHVFKLMQNICLFSKLLWSDLRDLKANQKSNSFAKAKSLYSRSSSDPQAPPMHQDCTEGPEHLRFSLLLQYNGVGACQLGSYMNG